MNKKDIIGKMRFLPLFAIFIFVGCTLMMEGEDELAPEEKGFDEPVTEVTEYGTATYQYQEGVKPVTENVLEYVVESDEDGVVYFLDNIPSKWMPKVGEYLFSGCNPKIPDGLSGKVTNITKENGMYRVELSPATEDEIFKELEFTLDFDYNMPNLDDVPKIDSTMTEEEKAAACYYDWSFFGTDDQIKERYNIKSVKRSKIKRKNNEDETAPEDKEKDSITWDIKWDSRLETKPAPVKKISEYLNKYLNDLIVDMKG